MWLQNLTNGRYYPYTDFLASGNDMIVVYDNPYTTPKDLIEKETPEEAEERRIEEIEEVVAVEEPVVTTKPAPKRIAKPVVKKGKPKK